MTAMAVVQRMTAAEFLALPEQELREGKLVGGELVFDPPIRAHEPTCSQIPGLAIAPDARFGE